MKFSIYLLIVLTINCATGQVGNTVEKGATLQTGTASTPFLRATTNSVAKIVGSEYLNEEWTQAAVTDLNTNKKVRLLARFNAYAKEIELLRENDIIALTPAEGVSVLLEGKTFVPATLKGTSKAIFVERLVNGNMRLFRVYDVKIIKAPSDATLLNVDTADNLKIIDGLYYQKDGGATEKLPNKKKSFEALVDGPTKTLIKKEKLSIKKEKDVIRIFDYLNKNSAGSK